jgi:hypothetical protein
VRLGNTTRGTLLRYLAPLLPSIEQALASGERIIEISPEHGQ